MPLALRSSRLITSPRNERLDAFAHRLFRSVWRIVVPISNSNAPRGAQVAEIHPLDEIVAFDQLPPRIRRVMDEAPCNLSATHVLRHYQAEGETAVLRSLNYNYHLYLNMMAKETGFPPCFSPLLNPMRSGSRGSPRGLRASGLPSRVRRRLNLRASDLTAPTVAG